MGSAMDDIKQGDLTATEFALLKTLFWDAATAEKAYEIDLERSRNFQKRSSTYMSSTLTSKLESA